MIDGSILIGAKKRHNDELFYAINPATNNQLAQGFSAATPADVIEACLLAEEACPSFSGLEPSKRAQFIEAVGEAIAAIGDELIETAMAETGLPRARLEGERGRTIGQLNMFAAEVRKGEWLDAVIDPALPNRAPLPRADVRRMNIAVGPVAVFGASNFPLAFSVAGGDTASAFAAGCPVVVKGHPAHPGTGELVARAIQSAVAACGLHAGVFSYLPGTSHALGAALVADPRIKAVGFTGSRSGGLALVQLAAQRKAPIPVYAEMSSINPVIVMPHALAARATALGTAFAASLSLGAGQFCTNPGLVIALDGADLETFITAARAALDAIEPPVMLTPVIHAAYASGVTTLDTNAATSRLSGGQQSALANRCSPALFETTASAFLADEALSTEVFGAAALIVRCRDIAEITHVVRGLEGQLTATLQIDDGDNQAAAHLLPLLQTRVGRVLVNGWPTGVEVTPAMVHGGPFPATSDGRTTSVGTLAMMRFLRPVCFQDVGDVLLPMPLRSTNMWGVPRKVSGTWEPRA